MAMKRQRGRGRKPNGGNHNPNRAYESNGPDQKVRGAAQTIFEKYQQLARDAMSSGDRILAENYLQHSEHYLRLIKSAQPNFRIKPDIMVSGYAGEDDYLAAAEEDEDLNGDGGDDDVQARRDDRGDFNNRSNNRNRDRYDRDRNDRPDRSDRQDRPDRGERPDRAEAGGDNGRDDQGDGGRRRRRDRFRDRPDFDRNERPDRAEARGDVQNEQERPRDAGEPREERAPREPRAFREPRPDREPREREPREARPVLADAGETSGASELVVSDTSARRGRRPARPKPPAESGSGFGDDVPSFLAPVASDS